MGRTIEESSHPSIRDHQLPETLPVCLNVQLGLFAFWEFRHRNGIPRGPSSCSINRFYKPCCRWVSIRRPFGSCVSPFILVVPCVPPISGIEHCPATPATPAWLTGGWLS